MSLQLVFFRHILNGMYVYTSNPKETWKPLCSHRYINAPMFHIPLSSSYSLKVAPQQSFRRFATALKTEKLYIFLTENLSTCKPKSLH